jgi:hypothetical protein
MGIAKYLGGGRPRAGIWFRFPLLGKIISRIRCLGNRNKQEIKGIVTAFLGTEEQVEYAEQFIPEGARLPAPKAANFERYLFGGRPHLWAIYDSDDQRMIVGFILIGDAPHKNSIGFGINMNHARRGLMKRAWNEIRPHLSEIGVQSPLNAYTSERNQGAHKFLTAIGFVLQDEKLDFLGESSNRYVYHL